MMKEETLPGIGKFSPPKDDDVYPVNLQTNGWPVGARQFGETWYLAYNRKLGGPFTEPEQAIKWMMSVDGYDEKAG